MNTGDDNDINTEPETYGYLFTTSIEGKRHLGQGYENQKLQKNLEKI